MADNEDETTQDTDNPGDLRKQLDSANKAKAEQAKQLQAYQQDEQLRDAGFGHLNKRQRGAVLRELSDGGQQFTPEAATLMAKELGFPTEPVTTGQSQGQQQQSQGQDNGQQQDQQQVEEALSAMDVIQNAGRLSANSRTSMDLVDEMNKTNDADSLRELIRKKGPRSGIVHEWDVP